MDLVTQYALVYCIIDAALLFFSIIIYRAITQDFGSEEEVFRFRQLVGAAIVYLISDVILGLVYGNFIYLHFYANMVTVYTNIVSLGVVAFLWYRYALLRISSRLEENPIQRVISSIPIIFVALFMSGSVFNGWAFTLVDSGGFEPGRWFTLTVAVGSLYLIFVSIFATAKFFSAPTRSQRTSYLWMILFIFPPILALLVEAFVPRTPVMAIGIYASIYLLFFFYQANRINNDSLTQLNNRRRMDEYLEDHLGSGPMLFYLFDVNRFKEINDQLGHSEGDRALCDVAEAVRQACASRQAIAGRYGGDEFVVIQALESDGAEVDPSLFVSEVRRRLTSIVQARGLPYALTLSAGFTRIEPDETDTSEIFARADAMMYEDKRIWHER